MEEETKMEVELEIEGLGEVVDVIVDDQPGQLEMMEENKLEVEINEDNWQELTGLNENILCGAIETLVFMSDRPLSILKIKKNINDGLPLRIVHNAIGRLQQDYEKEHHGIRLQEVAEGYQFRSKATYSKYVHDLFKITGLSLTPSALEVLAIIAYKQPVSKHEIERIRGVDSSHIVRALMDKSLVKICGRSEEMGKPVVYGTSNEFLEVFNLKDISELPPEYELENLAAKKEVGEIADIRNLITSKGGFYNNDPDLSELDELSLSIKSISTDTAFTKSLRSEESKRKNQEDSGPQRSAFDLLEEFILKEEIAQQNRAAALSELLTSVAEPKVASPSYEGFLNAPVEENFEYLDEVEQPDPHLDADALEAALDNAFEKMTASRDYLSAKDLSEEEDLSLQEKEQAVDKASKSLVEKAEELDIDLQFFQTDDGEIDKDSNVRQE